MKAKGIRGFYVVGCAVIGFLLLCTGGCFDSAGELDRSDAGHPLLKKASDHLRARDVDGAIKLYYEALGADSSLARAHLELGLIFDEHKEDYLRAVYHYQRYLEMRPKTEKQQLIRDAVRHSRMAYAASLPERPSEAIQEIADLTQENRILRQRNRELMGRLEEKLAAASDNANVPSLAPVSSDPVVRPNPVPSEPRPAPTPTRPSPTPTPAVLTSTEYVVERGDTLISISKKVYGTSKRWKLIYTANRARIGTTYKLKIGQRLKIPRDEGSQ